MDKDIHGIFGISAWWLYTHPSEKYELVTWDDECNPILMGKFKKWQPNHQPDILQHSGF